MLCAGRALGTDDLFPVRIFETKVAECGGADFQVLSAAAYSEVLDWEVVLHLGEGGQGHRAVAAYSFPPPTIPKNHC